MTRTLLLWLAAIGVVTLYGVRARRINAVLDGYGCAPAAVRRRRLSEELAEAGVG